MCSKMNKTNEVKLATKIKNKTMIERLIYEQKM